MASSVSTPACPKDPVRVITFWNEYLFTPCIRICPGPQVVRVYRGTMNYAAELNDGLGSVTKRFPKYASTDPEAATGAVVEHLQNPPRVRPCVAPTPPPYGTRRGAWAMAGSFMRAWAHEGRDWVNVGLHVEPTGLPYLCYEVPDRGAPGEPLGGRWGPWINLHGPVFDRPPASSRSNLR